MIIKNSRATPGTELNVNHILLFSSVQPAKLCGLILRSQLIVLLKHKVRSVMGARCRLLFVWFRTKKGKYFQIHTVSSCSVLAGVCGISPVPADAEEAPAEGLQGCLSPLPPHPEHPRLPGWEGVYDGPHRVHERNTLHCTTGNKHTTD